MSGPLAGLRVLEVASVGPVPFCGMVLSDLGAEVIRIDRPPRPPIMGIDPAQVLARGRRSLCLDLAKPAAVDCFLRLVGDADAVIEGLRPGVTERLGIGPDACLARNPALVYGRATGWGQDGPLRDEPGHDINFIAVAGALYPIGQADQPPPPPLSLIGDFGGGGMLLAVGVLSAVLSAVRTGVGDVVDAAMVDGAALLTTVFHELIGNGRWSEKRGANLVDGGTPFYGTYATADAKFVAVGAMEPEFFAELATALNLSPEQRGWYATPEHWAELRTVLADRFASKRRDEWLATAACVSPVLSMQEAPDHPHNRSRRLFVDVDGIRQPAPAPRFRSFPDPTPAPGRNEVLGDHGFTATEIDALVESGALILT